jgi:hypothetical protein
VHLSLSLLSIRYYEKMNFSNRGRWIRVNLCNLYKRVSC